MSSSRKVSASSWVVGRAMKTSHAVKLSNGLLGCGLCRGERGVFVVGLAGAQAVVQAAEEAVEQVALRGCVAVACGSAPVVVGAGAGWGGGFAEGPAVVLRRPGLVFCPAG